MKKKILFVVWALHGMMFAEQAEPERLKKRNNKQIQQLLISIKKDLDTIEYLKKELAALKAATKE